MKATLSYYFFIVIFLLPVMGKAQYIAVTGNITNIKNAYRLENVNVYESKSTIGTITNQYGFYKLLLKKGEAEIVITFPGYKDFTQRLVITSDTTFNVKLQPLVNLKSKEKDEIQARENTENKKSN